MNWFHEYVSKQKDALASIALDKVNAIVRLFAEALKQDRQIFVCGNGGSASNASHFVTDLGKGSSDKVGKRFRCLSLNDNVSWMTALGNDYLYEDVFVGQLQNYGRAGDILFVMSVSGSSPNLVKAVKWANENGLQTICLVGGKGGELAKIGKHVVVINDQHYGRAEDAHMAICHMICYSFMENPSLAT